jgi:hypothetical protein
VGGGVAALTGFVVVASEEAFGLFKATKESTNVEVPGVASRLVETKNKTVTQSATGTCLQTKRRNKVKKVGWPGQVVSLERVCIPYN